MENSSISVAVRVRPFSDKEQALLSTTYNEGPALFSSDPNTSSSSSSQSHLSQHSTPQPPRLSSGGFGGSIRKVLKVLDSRILVFDPPETNAVASFQKNTMPQPMGKKVKDIRFCFDRVFDEECGQEEVYDGSAKELVGHVMNGFHSTVFAYGATGCGKTHTISGSQAQPGIVFLIMKDLFARIAARSGDTDFSLTVSYLEIYNETIRDLLAPESGPLALRESPNGSAAPAGLSTKEPTCATDVVEWITLGNQNRTVNATEANATSSRSHAVLTVTVAQRAKAGGLTDSHSTASLSVIDLAGSERASVTKNKGERLIEGANINRSLLALGNCINALCDPRKRGHVPYRDSKLTRLLKQSLGGNCKTVMIVCVSPSSMHYDETHNTLQYANRAKEIKTKAIRNIISVDRHVAQYCQQILEQGQQIDLLKAQLAKHEASSNIHEREEDLKAITLAKQKLISPWEAGRDRLVQGERARVEKHVMVAVLNILQGWQSTALPPLDPADPFAATNEPSVVVAIKNGYENLVQSLSRSAAQLARDVEASGDALVIYNALVSNLSTSMKISRPGALPLFALESRLLEARLDSAMAEAREGGLVEGMKVQARAMHAISLAKAQIVTALDAAREDVRAGFGDAGLERALRLVADGIDSANSQAFLAMLNPQSFVGSGVPSSSTLGAKRDQGSRSPFEPQSVWTKAPRATVSGVGSAPSGQLASPVRPLASTSTTSTFRKQSPRKGVSFPVKRDPNTSPRKRKEVQWRDEKGDGQQLEDVKWRSPATDASTPESVASTSSLTSISSPTTPKDSDTASSASYANPWQLPPPSSSASSSTISAGAAAEQMTANIKRRISATGPLRSKASLSRIPPLAPLAEEGKPFSFLNHPPPRFSSATSSSSLRSVLSDLANTSVSGNTSISSTGSSPRNSFSMAGPKGLYEPLVPSATSSSSTPTGPLADTPRRAARAARRGSNIGPLRSTKPNRRTSFIAPPTPAGGGSSFKSGRFVGVGGSAAFALPASARKSPRKVMIQRRPSLAIGTTAPSLAALPGSKSAARILARRESLATLNGGDAGAAAKRGSPIGSEAPKLGIWR